MLIVASRLEGLNDVAQDGKSGILVATEDVDGFVNAINRFGRDAVFREALGRWAKAYVESAYNWSVVASGYYKICLDLVQSHAAESTANQENG